MPYCGKCGIRLSGSELYCPSCGALVPPSSDSLLMRPCAGCGAMVDADEEVCPNCGRRLYDRVGPDSEAEKGERESRDADKRRSDDFDREERVREETVYVFKERPYQPVAGSDGYKSKYLSIFFCLFFGVFGVHRFYEGKIATGILYLLSFGLFGFGALIDLIILLTKPNPYRP